MPGPPPKKGARRRNARPEWMALPASGRSGSPPPWPKGMKSPAGVKAIWTDLWATPQAVAWERMGWTRVVARYALKLVEAEVPKSSAVLQGEVRQMEDRLGLSPMAMKRLQWEVVDLKEESDSGEADIARLDDYRSRLG